MASRLEPIMKFCIDKGLCLEGFEVLMHKESLDSDLDMFFQKISTQKDYLIFLNHCYNIKELCRFMSFVTEIKFFLNVNFDTLFYYCSEINEVIKSVESELSGKAKVFIEISERLTDCNYSEKKYIEAFEKIVETIDSKKIVIDDFGKGIANFGLLNMVINAFKIAGIKIDVLTIPYNICKEIVKHLLKLVDDDFFVIFEKVEEKGFIARFIDSFGFSKTKNHDRRDGYSLDFYYQGFVFKKMFPSLFMVFRNNNGELFNDIKFFDITKTNY